MRTLNLNTFPYLLFMYVWHLKSSDKLISVFLSTLSGGSIDVTELKCCLQQKGQKCWREDVVYISQRCLNIVEEQERKPKPARLTQVCLYWMTDRRTVLDMFGLGWGGAEPLAQPASMMDALVTDINTVYHKYLRCTSDRCTLKFTQN